MTPEDRAKQVYAEMQTKVRSYMVVDTPNGAEPGRGFYPAKAVSEPNEAEQIAVIVQAIREAEERGYQKRMEEEKLWGGAQWTEEEQARMKAENKPAMQFKPLDDQKQKP